MSDVTSSLSPAGVRHVKISAEDASRRLDKFLQSLWPQLPRIRIFRLVRRGEVRVNGKRVQPEHRLAEGDDIRVPPVRLAIACLAASTEIGRASCRERV